MTDPSLLVLASLANGEKHSYAIMEDIQAFAGLRLAPGTLYGTTSRLEQRGLIRAIQTQSRRQPCRITAPGAKYLKEELAILDSVVRTASGRMREA